MTLQPSPHFTLLCIALGATVIAAWCYVRFASRAPKDIKGVATHFVCSCIAAQFIAPLGIAVAPDSAAGKLAGIFGVAFPVAVYLLLAGFWLLSWGSQMIAKYR